jgi:uncharacterized protein (TIGR00369 family)
MDNSNSGAPPSEPDSGGSYFDSDLDTGGVRVHGLQPGHAFEAFEWRVVANEEGDWVMHMEVTPQVVNTAGALQGGLLATLIDSVAGMSVLQGDATNGRPTTSDMQISFIAAAKLGPVRAVAHVLHRGRRSAVVRVDVRDLGAGGRHVATATLRFAFMSPSADPTFT